MLPGCLGLVDTFLAAVFSRVFLVVLALTTFFLVAGRAFLTAVLILAALSFFTALFLLTGAINPPLS